MRRAVSGGAAQEPAIAVISYALWPPQSLWQAGSAEHRPSETGRASAPWN
jgi:hypothetical protein